MAEESCLFEAIFASIRCFVQSLTEDLVLLVDISARYRKEANGCASSLQELVAEAFSKLESDAAGFMRIALRMYNLIEQGFAYRATRSSLQETLQMESFIREFVQHKLDVAAEQVVLEQGQGVTMGIVREHSLLLANTLRTMAEEMQLGGSNPASGQDDGQQQHHRKRQCPDT